MKYSLTIFTPTFNRAYILPQLKDSLLRQDRFDFEWLIIDDGSTDDTQDVVRSWQQDSLPFIINYFKTKNGGKPRAINEACKLAQSDWIFLMDSDDHFADNVTGFILDAIESIKDDNCFVGVGFLQGNKDLVPRKNIDFKNCVDATNLQRKDIGLNVDCNEVYRVSTLRKFPFEVWDGEIFTPEEVVLNEMALQGYKLRWYNKVVVISEYLEDGMTRGAWGLIKRNPMGYAMLFNHRLKHVESLKERMNSVCQFIAYCLIGGNPRYITKCNSIPLALLLLPVGCLLAIRRSRQLKSLK